MHDVCMLYLFIYIWVIVHFGCLSVRFLLPFGIFGALQYLDVPVQLIVLNRDGCHMWA